MNPLKRLPDRLKTCTASNKEEVDNCLLIFMNSRGAPSGRSRGIASRGIHKNCYDTSEAYGKKCYYVTGTNIAGFTKVDYATLAYGVV